VIEVHLVQNHGGWNSDDNQNNNLGRFRISVTTTPERPSIRCPMTCARSVGAARAADSEPIDADVSGLSQDGPEWHDDNARIDELWNQHPKARRNSCSPSGAKCGRRFSWRVGTFETGFGGRAGVPAFLHPCRRRRADG